MTRIKGCLLRRKGVLIATGRDAKLCVMDVSIRVMEKKSITSEATVLGGLRVCQLVWLVAMRIV